MHNLYAHSACVSLTFFHPRVSVRLVAKVYTAVFVLTDVKSTLSGWLDDRLYNKSVVSPARLQYFASNRFVYNILTCRDVVDKSVVSPANPFDVVQNGQIYSVYNYQLIKSVSMP
jgi:hypothetical protein